MEKKSREATLKSREFSEVQIPAPVKVLIGGLAYGIIKDITLENLLDDESHHEFANKIKILSEFVEWFKHPEIRVLKTRDHITVFRYLISVYMRAYHRNLKHKIVLKLSSTGKVMVIFQ